MACAATTPPNRPPPAFSGTAIFWLSACNPQGIGWIPPVQSAGLPFNPEKSPFQWITLPLSTAAVLSSLMFASGDSVFSVSILAATEVSKIASNRLFSYYYRLFCRYKKVISISFNVFQTLLAKHPGWGVPLA